MGLTKTALTRPIFIFMLMALCIIGGFWGYSGMRKEQNPDVQFGFISITTIYPGAGPEEINTLVSRKIEDAVSGVAGLVEVTSTSQEGVSVVGLQFNIGVNMDVALNDVRTAVDSTLNTLPREIEKPVVDKNDTTSEPILSLAVKHPTLDAQELRDLIDEKIKDRFGQIPGVALVAVSGGDIREIQVRLDRAKMLSYGVGIGNVQQAIAAATVNIPSGRVESGGTETSVRVLGEFESAEEMRQMILNIQDPNNPQAKATSVRLGDVATVEDTVAEKRQITRLDGNEAIVLSIQKTREGNAVEISKTAKGLIAQLKDEFGVEITKTFDSSILIEEALLDLLIALFFGIFLVTVIVYVFLHNFRGTIIVGIAIPVCLLATLMLMRLFGFTVNNLSMLALSLAVGVLVDDAIVVLENIFRHLRMGEEPEEAAVNGRSEIGLAAISITLADVVVFVPVGLMGGVVGQFFKPLAFGFAIAVMLSLFVSFTVTPLLAARWYRKGEDVEHPTGRFAQWFDRGFTRFEGFYGRLLRWSLAHRWFVFIGGFVVLIGVFMMIGGGFTPNPGAAIGVGMPLLVISTVIGLIVGLVNLVRGYGFLRFIAFGALFGLAFPLFALAGYGYAQYKKGPLFNFQFFPESDSGQVQAAITMPSGTSLGETQRVVEAIEKVIMGHPDVKYTVSRVGVKGGGFGAADQGANFAQINGTLHDKAALLDTIFFWSKKPDKLRYQRDTAVVADVIEKVGKIPGAQVIISAGQQQGFGSPIQMSFQSDDREKLLATVTDIRDRLAAGEIDGVILPDISSKPGKPELRAIPDRTAMGDLGLSTAEIALAMRTMYEGNTDVKFRDEGKEYDIRVMMSLEDRNNPDLVGQVPIRFVNGLPIYLSSVARLEPGFALDKIDRRQRIQEIRVTAELVPGKAAGTVQAQIDQWLVEKNLIPEGVKRTNLGQADVQRRESGFLFGALLTGFFLVYMLLASLYNNLLYPFIIQLAQPQALVGALLALIFTDKSLNIVGFIGIIALVGLVGKNAILLVDYTNTLRERGRSRFDALVESGPARLRPILMTTLAIIIGNIPVALAVGRGSEFRETIGIIIIGGVAVSTILTLLVIPASYTIFDDLSMRLSRRHREYWVRREAELAAEGALGYTPAANGTLAEAPEERSEDPSDSKEPNEKSP